MRIKEGFELRDVCGEQVVVAHGVENIDFSHIISMNESAAFLWGKANGKDFTTEELIQALCFEYDVQQSEAEKDVLEMILKWRELGLIA